MSKSNQPQTSVQFNGKEVHNPVGRGLVVLGSVMATAIIICGVTALLVFTTVTISYLIGGLFLIFAVLVIASIPVHFVLRRLGRRGFLTSRHDYGEVSWEFSINRHGFDRVR